MNLKNAALSLALVLIIALSMIPVYRAYRLHVETESLFRKKPNILVVSLCSFRMNLLSFYGAATGNAAPNIEKFFDQSTFIYTNAVNALSWTNLFNYTLVNIVNDDFQKGGYFQSGYISGYHLWRIPYRLTYMPAFAGQIINDNDFEKNHQELTARLEEALSEDRSEPFFTVAHFKYLHYPIIDRFNGGTHIWDRFLNVEERAKVVEYLNDPAKYHQKLPFLLMLANNPEHILAHPRFQKAKRDAASMRSMTGLMTNPTLLAEWKASEGYALDLRILEKIYRANVLYLDKVIAPLLNLYGNKNLQDNTIVIFSGDHGELHMERDELSHGQSLWDLSLRVPLAVRFPDSWGREVITEQVDFTAISKALKQVILGENTAADFKRNVAKYSTDAVVARNCTNTVRGVRFKNKYKYFIRIADGERFLFDLEKDPHETKNIALERPDEADRMEGLYWQNLESITAIDPNHCAPSAPGND